MVGVATGPWGSVHVQSGISGLKHSAQTWSQLVDVGPNNSPERPNGSPWFSISFCGCGKVVWHAYPKILIKPLECYDNSMWFSKLFSNFSYIVAPPRKTSWVRHLIGGPFDGQYRAGSTKHIARKSHGPKQFEHGLDRILGGSGLRRNPYSFPPFVAQRKSTERESFSAVLQQCLTNSK